MHGVGISDAASRMVAPNALGTKMVIQHIAIRMVFVGASPQGVMQSIRVTIVCVRRCMTAVRSNVVKTARARQKAKTGYN
jgi:hypothetical protein